VAKGHEFRTAKGDPMSTTQNRMATAFGAALVAVSLQAAVASSALAETPAELVTEFYTQALTVNSTTTPDVVLGRILADDFQSLNGQESKDKATLIGQLGYMWALVPDMAWQPVEVLVDGNKVIVRSVATGSPKGEFMGLTLDGSKSFKIDTIDIHTVEGGQITQVYHLEDWATAMQQLSQ
jgi:predicted ester cyclase